MNTDEQILLALRELINQIRTLNDQFDQFLKNQGIAENVKSNPNPPGAYSRHPWLNPITWSASVAAGPTSTMSTTLLNEMIEDIPSIK